MLKKICSHQPLRSKQEEICGNVKIKIAKRRIASKLKIVNQFIADVIKLLFNIYIGCGKANKLYYDMMMLRH